MKLFKGRLDAYAPNGARILFAPSTTPTQAFATVSHWYILPLIAESVQAESALLAAFAIPAEILSAPRKEGRLIEMMRYNSARFSAVSSAYYRDPFVKADS